MFLSNRIEVYVEPFKVRLFLSSLSTNATNGACHNRALSSTSLSLWGSCCFIFSFICSNLGCCLYKCNSVVETWYAKDIRNWHKTKQMLSRTFHFPLFLTLLYMFTKYSVFIVGSHICFTNIVLIWIKQ